MNADEKLQFDRLKMEMEMAKIKAENSKQPKSGLAGVNVSTVIQGVMAAAIIGFYVKIDKGGNTNIIQDQKIQNIQDNQTKISGILEKLESQISVFTAYPRHTKADSDADFQVGIQPLVTSLNRLTTDVGDLKENLRESNRERQQLKLQLQLIEAEVEK